MEIKAARLYTLATMGHNSYSIESLPRGHRLFMYAVAEAKWLSEERSQRAMKSRQTSANLRRTGG